MQFKLGDNEVLLLLPSQFGTMNKSVKMVSQRDATCCWLMIKPPGSHPTHFRPLNCLLQPKARNKWEMEVRPCDSPCCAVIMVRNRPPGSLKPNPETRNPISN